MNELKGAFRRHARADEHLTNLEGVVQRIIQLCDNGVLADVDPDTGDWTPSRHILDPLKLDAGVIVGEIVHNLRAALDYLVYVLAAHDSGSPQQGTQFLIEDTPQGFTGRSPRNLKGVSEEHIAIIRQFQPYKGAHWTGVLRDLDNAAKHREIVSVDIDQNIASILVMNEFAVADALDADGNPNPQGANVYLKGPAQVALPEGLPLVQTLRDFRRR